MPNKRMRHIRAHAVKVGDEINFNTRWWIVNQSDKDEAGDPVLVLRRGSQDKAVSVSRNRVVKVMRLV